MQYRRSDRQPDRLRGDHKVPTFSKTVSVGDYSVNTNIAAADIANGSTANLPLDQQKYFHIYVDDIHRARPHPTPMEADWIIRFYNQRGTAEQHIKEGKQAINWTRLSCKGMAQNEVRLQLHALACNPGVVLQGTDLPGEIADWSLTSLQTRLIKTGARVVRHARAITFQLAGVAVSGNLFNRVLAAIQRLRAPPVPT